LLLELVFGAVIALGNAGRPETTEGGQETVSSALDIREHLLQSSNEFRKLAEEHSAYDEKLSLLLNRSFLSEQEKLEEVTLKKLKLRAKDRMQQMIQAQRQQQG